MAQADPVRLAVMFGFVGASLFAGYGGYRALTAGRPTEAAPVAQAAVPGTQVLTASAAIARGEPISAPQLRAIYLQGAAPGGSFAEPEALVGKVATTDILPGQIMLAGMVSAERSDGGLAVLIPPGRRAIAIPIAEDVAVSNLVRAADLVDVLLVLRAGVLPHDPPPAPTPGAPAAGGLPTDPGDASETRVLLQAVPVLTVGDRIGQSRPATAPDAGANPPPRAEPSRTLTLSLTPEQAETLALGRTLGSLELALRNPHDTDETRRPTVTLQELRGAVARPAVLAAVDPRRPIELIIGNERRTIYSLDAPAPAGASPIGAAPDERPPPEPPAWLRPLLNRPPASPPPSNQPPSNQPPSNQPMSRRSAGVQPTGTQIP